VNWLGSGVIRCGNGFVLNNQPGALDVMAP
jgi:hypothetical protein